MAEITNRGELQVWLEDKPREIAVAIAARAALRSLPFLSRLIERYPETRHLDDDLTSWLRCIIISGVAGTCPTLDVKTAAADAARAAAARAAAAYDAANAADAAAANAADAAAANAADAAADAAAYAAAYAADAYAAADAAAADADAAAADAFWGAVAWDATRLESDGDVSALMAHSIWPGTPPDLWGRSSKDFRDYFGSKPELVFWNRWFARMANGDPPDWKMQTEIVLIPNEDWSKGAKHVSGLIGEIEARYQPARVAPEVLRKQVDVLFERAAASEMTASALAEAIEIALQNHAKETGGGNALPPELEVLGRMPQTLRGIARVVQSEPTSERVAELEALVE